ncbi:MAG: ABC transporter permease, partial [Chthoniobacterales bacterium]
MNVLQPFLEGTIRTATPLAFAALGETVVERSGIINIGLEGAIIAGAMGGFIATGVAGIWVGFAGAAASGLFVGLVFAVFAIRLR